MIECKVLRDSDRRSLDRTVERGVEQTLGYMAKCNAEEGHLVVIDRRGSASHDATEAPDGRSGSSGDTKPDGGHVTVWTL